MINGKQVRMKKLFPHSKAVFLALDHGFSMGPIKGIESLKPIVELISSTQVDALIINYGAFKNLDISFLPNCRIPFVINLSGGVSSNSSKNKLTIYKGIDALKIGADAVSIQINLGTDNELIQVERAAGLIAECDSLGLPVLAMMYNKGANGEKEIKSMVRMGVELGFDMIKIDTDGNNTLLKDISTHCDIPILLAGGVSEKSSVDFMNKVDGYMLAGAKGISVGRNVFENERPAELMEAVCQKVHYEK